MTLAQKLMITEQHCGYGMPELYAALWGDYLDHLLPDAIANAVTRIEKKSVDARSALEKEFLRIVLPVT